MPDLLVNLLKLPEPDELESGVLIRRAQPFELTRVLALCARKLFRKLG